jgi:hypothetical protein
MDYYLFNLLGRPRIKNSMEPKNGKNKVTRTQINLSFPLNSDLSILIRARIGNIIAIIIIDCQIKRPILKDSINSIKSYNLSITVFKRVVISLILPTPSTP